MVGCAQTSPLTGGEKDEYAPAIDSAKTYPINGQINFSGREINIKFNEYIQLNKPTENILIIPRQETPAIITSKNKKLKIEFQDELLPNTTYNITFNRAIQDITERNDSVFQYVFSTGDYIDSLSISGLVKESFTNIPLKEVVVGLYPKSVAANFDSIPYKFEPTYLGITDKSGRFKLSYIKDGSYYLFAIQDKNKNLKYERGEQIAFLKERSFLLNQNIDTLSLHAFKEETDECYVKKKSFTYPGRLEIVLSNDPDTIHVTANSPLKQEDTGSADSLVYWMMESPSSGSRFYLYLNDSLDTLKPVYKDIPEKPDEVKLKSKNNLNKGKLLPGENLKITFTEPIGRVEENNIQFLDADSNEVKTPDYQLNLRTLEFMTAGTNAQFVSIDSAAVISVFNRMNEKNIELMFENESDDFYGTLIVTIDTTFDVPVILHVLDDKNEIVRESVYEQGQLRFEKMIPGNYQLRLIFDTDNNGEWTSGSLSEIRLPEKVVYNTETVRIKSKWDKEIDWIFTGN